MQLSKLKGFAKLPLLLAAVAVSFPVAAQNVKDYPNRPVRIVTPAAPGGTTDFLARLLANHLSKAWNQQAIVDNRGSASGVNGAQIVKEAAPDGYTLFIPYHQHTVNAALIPKLPYHPVDDFTAITQMTAGGLLLVVNLSHPAKNAKEFVEWAKSTKDPINFGSAGIGSGGHLAGELFKLMANTKGQHIPYKGTGPAVIGLMGGEYHYNFMGLTGAFTQVRAGKLRAIAVSGPARIKAAPDVPSLSEVLPGFSVVGWYGVTAPANLPKPLLTKIHAEIANYVKSAEFGKVAEANGSEAVTNSPEEFRKFMLEDMKKWADVVKRAGIKA
ncbi:MAG: tripartite tricarboxylate transporter substrate binding protein [Burkholderiales bacterium]|nr:tripartite tricarboxylate transporter substrate binding protein [Burkholderiales bacterium]MDP2397826.1 tripartite tricarboxylate transporter substrate binding protein [Burkholderiales bacterium]